MSNLPPRPNLALLEERYTRWKENPQEVEADWRAFFEGFELGMAQPPPPPPAQTIGETGALGSPAPASTAAPGAATDRDASGRSAVDSGDSDPTFLAKVVRLVYGYRSIGHTAAWIDPLSPQAPVIPELELEAFGLSVSDSGREVPASIHGGSEPIPLGDLIGRLRATWCGRSGFEFMHIHNAEVRGWLRRRIEATDPSPVTEKEALTWLTEAGAFEEFLHRTYVGQKRFSLEGGEATMVALETILRSCPELGVEELCTGMAHRGRLTVLANFLKKPLGIILHEFSANYVPDLVAGDGDVKYHLGFETRRSIGEDGEVFISLAANPSHLEAVNGVVEGQARARQRILDDKPDRKRVLPLLLHGDAAFAGQGTVAELLNLSQLTGYRTGGTIHIIINNQIGFTTQPEDARSSAYCTDVAKMIEAPVIHVNGDAPMEVARAARIAVEFRQQFGRDVVLDIVCYRRHGHNEGDEPSFTQPQYSRAIKSHPTPARLFRDTLVESGNLSAGEADGIEAQARQRLESEFEALKETPTDGDGQPSGFEGSTAISQKGYSYDRVPTGVPREDLVGLGHQLLHIPEGFRLHPTIARRFLPPRAKALEEGEGIDWAHGEALAFASLLTSGNSVRLSGQDVRRGTFSQRHCVLYDTETRDRHIPLMNLGDGQATFHAFNSLLSEAAVLAFDYGYSITEKDVLVCWEAQFGDFVNGAQVMIDQFISSAESKWGQPSSIVLLLPHGYEGQGPSTAAPGSSASSNSAPKVTSRSAT